MTIHNWFIVVGCFRFWSHGTACGILVPQLGIIKPESSAVKAQSPNHWTTREFPIVI